jgi:hypothetical protein
MVLQIVLRVWLDSSHERYVEAPITPSTSAADVLDCCRQPGEDDCHLAELWRGCGKCRHEYIMISVGMSTL